MVMQLLVDDAVLGIISVTTRRQSSLIGTDDVRDFSTKKRQRDAEEESLSQSLEGPLRTERNVMTESFVYVYPERPRNEEGVVSSEWTRRRDSFTLVADEK
jgi:hypothetical protein